MAWEALVPGWGGLACQLADLIDAHPDVGFLVCFGGSEHLGDFRRGGRCWSFHLEAGEHVRVVNRDFTCGWVASDDHQAELR